MLWFRECRARDLPRECETQNVQVMHDTRHTHAGRVRIDLVRFGRVKRDGFFPGIEDKGFVDGGFSVLSNREKGERDSPTAP